MNTGETLRFLGPGGAEFVITVGVVFEAEYVDKMVSTGEWKPVTKPESKRTPRKAAPK